MSLYEFAEIMNLSINEAKKIVDVEEVNEYWNTHEDEGYDDHRYSEPYYG